MFGSGVHHDALYCICFSFGKLCCYDQFVLRAEGEESQAVPVHVA